MNIWQKLRKEIIEDKAGQKGRPLIVLAPMADVTDIAFRTLIAECGNPDMMWTEFVSADGLVRATPEGRLKLMADLIYKEGERPIVAQLFGSNPEYMEQAAYLVASLGFDGIDINMGCPDRSIEKQGAGAGMIKNPKRAQEIILAAKAGAKRFADENRGAQIDESINEPIPVSVKTRIGYNKNELETWIPALLEVHPAVITVHARTRKEMSLVPARWQHLAEAVAIRDRVQADLPIDERTLILGNGDVLSVEDGLRKASEAGADGAMLGRALFGNPWLFSGLKKIKQKKADENFIKNEKGDKRIDTGSTEIGAEDFSSFTQYQPTIEERLRMAIRHTELFVEHLGEIKSFAIMKKHFKAYVNGFDGAKELRTELMEKANTVDDVRTIIENFIKIYFS